MVTEGERNSDLPLAERIRGVFRIRISGAKGTVLYRETGGTSSPADVSRRIIQAYVDRWEIEVNHRDEEQHLGVGDPHVWKDASVDRFPAFVVASYAFLLLASLEAYGAKRTDEYLHPPKWQRRRTRPSCLDLLAMLRKEAMENPELLKSVDLSFEPAEACSRRLPELK